MRLAVIPARGGSQRIPRKNIRDFCGRPMIAWSIRAALESGCFDKVVVSTDDVQIAEVAKSHGAEVPFLRPAELADAHTGTRQVFLHAIRYFLAQGVGLEYAMLLYATAPLVTPERIAKGIQEWWAKPSRPERAMAVTRFAYPPQRGFTLDEYGRIVPPPSELLKARSQDLQPLFHDAGQFYFMRPDEEGGFNDKPFIDSATYPVVLPHYLVQDIDEEDDWIRTEALFHYLYPGLS